jgi:predicted Zn-dependent protease
LGDILNFAGRGEEALTLVEKAMRLNPRYPVTYLWSLGQAYRLVGKREEAATALRRAVLRNPDYLAAHMLLAVIYYELGREEEARAAAAEMLRINPRYSLAITKKLIPFQDPAAVEQVVNALEKAGLR